MGKKQQHDKGYKQKEVEGVSGTYHYAVGRRKSAIATVRLYPKGSGKIYVNGKELSEYFPIETDQITLVSPLTVTSNQGVDITIHVQGGGTTGQAEASRLGIARALIEWNADLRPVLKAQGLLTRDARVKERKKPGLKRARRAPQFSKR
ncbi:MAG: 30S ribosomal protein S9 [Patescibacteria group bacterium]